jgi:hypothetical protein
MEPTFSFAVGDQQTPLQVQITVDGVPQDLTGKNATFTMIRPDGTVKVAETPATITDIPLGYVDYEWAAGDVDEENHYTGFVHIYDNITNKRITFPGQDEGIHIEFFDVADPRPEADPTVLTDERFMELATAPKKVRTVEGMVEERSVDELLKIKAATDPVAPVPWGMRVAKIKPPSTTSS